MVCWKQFALFASLASAAAIQTVPCDVSRVVNIIVEMTPYEKGNLRSKSASSTVLDDLQSAGDQWNHAIALLNTTKGAPRPVRNIIALALMRASDLLISAGEDATKDLPKPQSQDVVDYMHGHSGLVTSAAELANVLMQTHDLREQWSSMLRTRIKI
ncbi:hypothetical protein CERZMDRAFT_88406 [Cercospora zeae-maydis SCOH1-5]|uniref:Uncharacterized protein n=1 Tax=Cercospora zeae-maydis SCOH1-5 TaxID=717836 RepID=A0A6A6EZB3_9PEZI|nr:hypothetical protein CERZMDRAFT_88406 [Cercospora zeae-maydis SCOH1-5]